MGAFVDETTHVLSDKEAEKTFSLQESLRRAHSKKLLDGISVYITPHTKPEAADMKAIVESSGGKVLTAAPTKFSEETLIISCKEDKPQYTKLIALKYKVYTNEFLLGGVLHQALDFKNNLLD